MEITVVELISAEAKKIQNEIKREEERREEEARRLRERLLDEERQDRIARSVPIMFGMIADFINNTYFNYLVDYVLYEDTLSALPIQDYYEERKEVLDIVKKLIEEAGYKVEEYYEYSKSWRKRSSKVGYFCIKLP